MARPVKSKIKITKKKVHLHTAIFGAGCFWGVEEAFRTTAGVISTEVGYAGGHSAETDYERVCGGDTGHAEVVKVTFDSSKVNYHKLLEIFWRIHDPTQMNRQGPDMGTQYRSVIFYTTMEQKKEAIASMAEEQKYRARTIATAIEKATTYVKAEEYHQQYIKKGGRAACHI
ncbi:MAG: peptide-methionine (S)-S-oxide reductase MsrA [Candidatus Pacearchaeota archaeon]